MKPATLAPTREQKKGAPRDTTPLGEKQYFTTGEAAQICNVSQQTIIRCFDAGRLGGFRVPGSKFRRIPREDLIQFMKNNQIPMGLLGGGIECIKVLSSGSCEVSRLLKEAGFDEGRFQIGCFDCSNRFLVECCLKPPALAVVVIKDPENSSSLLDAVHVMQTGIKGQKVVLVAPLEGVTLPAGHRFELVEYENATWQLPRKRAAFTAAHA